MRRVPSGRSTIRAWCPVAIRSAQGSSSVPQAVELEVSVALHAGVGRPARRMVGHVRSHYLTLEVVAEVEHVVLDAKGVSHPACVVNVGHCATPRVRLSAPQAQGHPNHVMARVAQEGGGH